MDALHIESLEVEKTQEEIKIDGNVQLIHDDVVQRIPAPSNDPNDPLNFPQWRKAGIMVILVWFCKSLICPWKSEEQTNHTS